MFGGILDREGRPSLPWSPAPTSNRTVRHRLLIGALTVATVTAALAALPGLARPKSPPDELSSTNILPC